MALGCLTVKIILHFMILWVHTNIFLILYGMEMRCPVKPVIKLFVFVKQQNQNHILNNVKNALKRLVCANLNHNYFVLNAGIHHVGVNQDQK